MTLSWNARLAYAVGLIATDGNLSSDGRHLSLTSSDREQLNNFRAALGTNAQIARNPPGSFTKRPSYRVQLSHVKLYQQLLGAGLKPRKTAILGALQIPLPFFRDFLRGVIDGDGSIVCYIDRSNAYKKTRYRHIRIYVSIASASLQFLQWIQQVSCQSLGVRGYFLQQPAHPWGRRTAWKLRFAKRDSMQILRWIYYAADVMCLQRKRIRAEQALALASSFRDKRSKARGSATVKLRAPFKMTFTR